MSLPFWSLPCTGRQMLIKLCSELGVYTDWSKCLEGRALASLRACETRVRPRRRVGEDCPEECSSKEQTGFGVRGCISGRGNGLVQGPWCIRGAKRRPGSRAQGRLGSIAWGLELHSWLGTLLLEKQKIIKGFRAVIGDQICILKR